MNIMKKKAYIKWSFMYMSFVFIVLGIVYISFFTVIEKEFKKELLRSYTLTYEMMEQNVNNFSQSIEEESQILAEDDEISQILASPVRDNHFYYNLRDISEKFSNIVTLNNYVSHIAVYDNKTGYIIENSSYIKPEYIYKDYIFEEGQTYESWKAFMESPQLMGFYRLSCGDIVYLNKIYDYSGKTELGTLIISVYNDVFRQLLSVDITENEGNVVAVYKDRTVYAMFDNDIAEYCLENADSTEKILNEEAQNDMFVFRPGKGRLKCFFAIGQDAIYQRLYDVAKTIFIALSLLLLLGIVLSVVFSKKQYKPVGALFELLNTEKGAEGGYTDFEYMRLQVNRLLHNKNLGEVMRGKYNTLLMNINLLSYLQDENSRKDVGEILDQLGIELKFKNFVLAMVNVISKDADIWKENPENNSLILDSVKNICDEMLGEEFFSLALPIKSEQFLFLITAKHEKSLIEEITAAYSKSVEFLSKHIGISLDIKLSEPFADINKTRYFYNHLTKNSSIQAAPGVTRCESETDNTSHLQNTKEFEAALRKGLKTGDKAQIDAALEICFENVKSERTLSLIKYDMINSVIGVIGYLGTDDKEECYLLMDRIYKSYSVTAVKEMMAELTQLLLDAAAKTLNDTDNARVNEIISYINDNFHSVDLNVNSIALNFGLHSKYISKMFKDSTGILLKDYILQVRFENAQKLLKQDIKISEIAGMCGFLNSNSFIRAFKKRYGLTPMEKRNELKFKENERND